MGAKGLGNGFSYAETGDLRGPPVSTRGPGQALRGNDEREVLGRGEVLVVVVRVTWVPAVAGTTGGGGMTFGCFGL